MQIHRLRNHPALIFAKYHYLVTPGLCRPIAQVARAREVKHWISPRFRHKTIANFGKHCGPFWELAEREGFELTPPRAEINHAEGKSRPGPA